MIALIFQIIFTSFYSLWIVKTISYGSYLLGIAALGTLAYKFLLWSLAKRTLLIALFVLAVASICLNAVLNIVWLEDIFSIRPSEIIYSRTLSGGAPPDETQYGLALRIAYISSFSLMWAASSVLSRSYSNIKNKFFYWSIASLPLIYFLSVFQSNILTLFSDPIGANPFLYGFIYTLLYVAILPIGGVIFSISFLHISRKMEQGMVKDFMEVSGFGLMLLFASNQPSGLYLAPFPPFGIVTSAFFGLSSVLLLVGIYFSALSVAQNLSLRKYIKKKAKEMALLDGIGSSEMKQATDSYVKTIVSDVSRKAEQLQEETGIEVSLDEQDFKTYLQLALNEARNSYTKNKNLSNNKS